MFPNDMTFTPYKIIAIVLTITTAHCIRYSRWGVKCPIPNSCVWGCDHRRKAMDCAESFLGPYSPELPDRHSGDIIWTADFSQNSISIIQNMAYFASYDEVIRFRSLNYSHNVIRTIEDRAFLGLEKDLHTLILDHNQLEVLPAVPISNLSGLHILSLSQNKLVSLDFVCANSLPRLHTLDVSDNQLREIDPSCFYGTRLGKTDDSSLILRDNDLRYLDVCTFQDRQFQTLDYTNNSFICMCEMSWLKDYNSGNVNEVNCYSSKDGDIMSMENYTRENCEAINVENIECVEMVVNATYERTSSNESEVHVQWHSKDFPHLGHFHATLYSFQDGALSEVGRYKLHRSVPEFRNSIKISREEGNDLVICIESKNKDRGGLSTHTARAWNESINAQVDPPIESARAHMQCQRVSIPNRPDPLLGSSRSGSMSSTTHSSTVELVLITVLIYIKKSYL